MIISPDHLSRVHTSDALTGIDNDPLDAHLFRVEVVPEELKDIVKFLHDGKALDGLSEKRKKILVIKATPYSLINRSLYRLGHDDILY